MLNHYNLNYGAIDFILDKNENYVFLELNPEGLWGWLDILANTSITKKLVEALLNKVA